MKFLSNYIYDPNKDSQCFFRSISHNKKALIKVTEKCNMKCKHCFNDSTYIGQEMSLDFYVEKLIPFLIKNNFDKVTLTGGEPTLNKHIYEMVRVTLNNNIKVTLCTNGISLKLREIKKFNNSRFKLNVSLDGFSSESYGSFRGVNENGFALVKKNIEELATFGYVKGILVTPNNYSSISEYVELVIWAKKISLNYVLFNKFAELGRGERSIFEFEVDSLKFIRKEMNAILIILIILIIMEI